MHAEELFFLEKEVSRLLKDVRKCSDPVCKELIRQDVLFLSNVIASETPVD